MGVKKTFRCLDCWFFCKWVTLHFFLQGVSAMKAFYELLSHSLLSVLHFEENKPVAPVELCPILKTLYKMLIVRYSIPPSHTHTLETDLDKTSKLFYSLNKRAGSSHWMPYFRRCGMKPWMIPENALRLLSRTRSTYRHFWDNSNRYLFFLILLTKQPHIEASSLRMHMLL